MPNQHVGRNSRKLGAVPLPSMSGRRHTTTLAVTGDLRVDLALLPRGWAPCDTGEVLQTHERWLRGR
jgi:hypothetical protein